MQRTSKDERVQQKFDVAERYRVRKILAEDEVETKPFLPPQCLEQMVSIMKKPLGRRGKAQLEVYIRRLNCTGVEKKLEEQETCGKEVGWEAVIKDKDLVSEDVEDQMYAGESKESESTEPGDKWDMRSKKQTGRTTCSVLACTVVSFLEAELLEAVHILEGQ